MEIKNLTPHTLNIHIASGVLAIPPSGVVTRVATMSVDTGVVGDIPTVRTSFGDVEDLDISGLGDDGIAIVSGMVLAALAGRTDLVDRVFAPGELVRDDAGRVIGCRGLRRLDGAAPAPVFEVEVYSREAAHGQAWQGGGDLYHSADAAESWIRQHRASTGWPEDSYRVALRQVRR